MRVYVIHRDLSFWNKVDRSRILGCWNWQGRVDKDGRGRYNSKIAHRFAFESFYGRKIKEGYELHHTCFNHRCCNPTHLKELTEDEHKLIHNRVDIRKRKSRMVVKA